MGGVPQSQIGSTSAGKERVDSENEASTERTIRMWEGGPLRQIAATKVSGTFIPYARTINGCHFAGRYVCDGCQQPSNGVRRQNDGRLSGNGHSRWLCDPCFEGRERKTRTLEQKQAAIDRLAAARRDRATVRIQRSEQMSMCKAVTAGAAEANPNREVYGIM